MSKIITTIDGSIYSDWGFALSFWAHERTGYSLSLLHAMEPFVHLHEHIDLSGHIGLGAKTDLHKDLVHLDEERGILEKQKSYLLLEQKKKELIQKGVPFDIIHRHGTLLEILMDTKDQAAMIVLGKGGENTSLDGKASRIGSNLEAVIRGLDKPILIAGRKDVPSHEKFLFAYDDSPSARKALEYVIESPLLKGMECVLLHVGQLSVEKKTMLQRAQERLSSAGFFVQQMFKETSGISPAIKECIDEHFLDFVVMGAYGHSRTRSMFLGSTTSDIIKNTETDLLVFH
jgi:nucleotide-binding universal stress UspA family protein